MKLAKRTVKLFPEGAYQVLGKAQALERSGKSIIHFETGQPDFDTPSNIKRTAIKAINEGKTKYTSRLN